MHPLRVPACPFVPPKASYRRHHPRRSALPTVNQFVPYSVENGSWRISHTQQTRLVLVRFNQRQYLNCKTDIPRVHPNLFRYEYQLADADRHSDQIGAEGLGDPIAVRCNFAIVFTSPACTGAIIWLGPDQVGDELLEQNIFYLLLEAQVVTERSQGTWNGVRLHSSLG